MSEGKLSYKLLSGPDDHAFCERISAALADGYRLHGGPAATVTADGQVIVAPGGGAGQRCRRTWRPAMTERGAL